MTWKDKEPCMYCGKNYYKSSLKAHERIHTGESPYSCTFCNRSFNQSGNRNRHMKTCTERKTYQRILTDESQFSCTFCGRSFNQSGNLKGHMNICEQRRDASEVNGRMQKIIAMEVIDISQAPAATKTLKHPDPEVLEEIPSGRSEDQFPCSYCGERFSAARKRRAHERIHTGERPYACKNCSIRFSTIKEWYDHERTCKGTSVNEPDLEEATRGSETSSGISSEPQDGFSVELDEESRNASSESPLLEVKKTKSKSNPSVSKSKRIKRWTRCHICGGIIMRASLSKHLLTHGRSRGTKEKFGECRFCGLRLSSSSNARRHEERLHGHIMGKSSPEIPLNLKYELVSPILIKKPRGRPRKRLESEETERIEDISLSNHSEDGQNCCTAVTRAAEESKVISRSSSDAKLKHTTINGYIRKHPVVLQGHASAYRKGKKRSFPCLYCHRKFSLKGNLMMHMRYYCQPKQHRSSSVIRTNTQIASEKDDETLADTAEPCEPGLDIIPRYCRFCGKKCSPSKLLLHEIQHTGEKPFPCGVCNKTFTTDNWRREHEAKCQLSTKMPASAEKDTLVTFQTSSDDQQPTVYNLRARRGRKCKKRRDSSKISMHITAHVRDNGTETFECDVCEFSSTVRSLVWEHVRRHDGFEPFRCGQCDRGFTRRDRLRNHMRKIHRIKDGKKFQCPSCPLRFDATKMLKSHQAGHGSKLPLLCCQCGKWFRYLEQLKEHLKEHKQTL